MIAIRDRTRFGVFLIVLGLTLALVNLGVILGVVWLVPVVSGAGSLVTVSLLTYVALALTVGLASTGFIGIVFVEIDRGRSAGPGAGMLDSARGALLIAATSGLSYFLLGLVLGFMYFLPGPVWRYVHLALFYLGSLAVGFYLFMLARRLGSDGIALVGRLAFAFGALSVLLVVLVTRGFNDGATSLWLALGSGAFGVASLVLWIVAFATIFRASPRSRPPLVNPTRVDKSSSDLTIGGP